jgi:hypothetical protein
MLVGPESATVCLMRGSSRLSASRLHTHGTWINHVVYAVPSASIGEVFMQCCYLYHLGRLLPCADSRDGSTRPAAALILRARLAAVSSKFVVYLGPSSRNLEPATLTRCRRLHPVRKAAQYLRLVQVQWRRCSTTPAAPASSTSPDHMRASSAQIPHR